MVQATDLGRGDDPADRWRQEVKYFTNQRIVPLFVPVIRVHGDGTWTEVANLSAFQMSHPVANPNPADFEPDGTWFSMVTVDDALYAVEPNHGELDRIGRGGSVTRIADISATQGHIVPTALAYHGGAFYIGNLGTFPIVEGSSKILRITHAGKIETVVTGLRRVSIAHGGFRDRRILTCRPRCPARDPPSRTARSAQ